MEIDIKKELMNSVDSIKNKIKQMKNQEHGINLSIDKMLKPVSEPLNSLVKSKKKLEVDKHLKNETSENFMEFESDENSSSSSTKCVSFHDAVLNSASNPKNENKQNIETSLENEDIFGIYDGVNVPFGIKTENKTLMMGNEAVSFSKIDSSENNNTVLVRIGGNTYNLTPGLQELLLRKKPDLKLITNIDKLVYKDILDHTNAHKRDFNPRGQIRGDKGTKYRQIIKPLFCEALMEKKNKLSLEVACQNLKNIRNILTWCIGMIPMN